MNRLPLIISFTFIFIFSFSSLASLDPNKILKKADGYRNPAKSFEMTVEVKTPENTSKFAVFLKGNNKTIIVTKEPSRDVGRNMLMSDRNFYAYIPNLRRSMRLSLSQKLSGQVANGDISRTRWHGDYEPSIENKDDKTIRLFLKGKKPNLTYGSIRITVDAKNYKPMHADFLSLNGKKVLKKAFFENYKPLAGADRPSTIRITDPNTDKTSYINIQSMKIREFNDGFFTQRNMESLR